VMVLIRNCLLQGSRLKPLLQVTAFPWMTAVLVGGALAAILLIFQARLKKG
jgi:hypothetical protein